MWGSKTAARLNRLENILKITTEDILSINKAIDKLYQDLNNIRRTKVNISSLDKSVEASLERLNSKQLKKRVTIKRGKNNAVTHSKK